MTNNNYSDLLNEAIRMYASGHDNKYIEMQFSEKGVDDKTIDEIITEIKKSRKSEKRSRGIKFVIYGVSILVVALIVSIILSYYKDSPFRYVAMWGLGLAGIMTIAKGITDILFP